MIGNAREIEKRIAELAEVYVAVEEDEGTVILSGIVGSEGERQAAIDIASELAPGRRVEDNIVASDTLPRELGTFTLAEGDVGAFSGSTFGFRERGGVDAGDFTDQHLMTDPAAASGAGSSNETDSVSDGGDAYVPPMDPVGTTTEVIGGFEMSSMDDVGVERSFSGGLSDDVIADAIRRELHEDAATTALEIHVFVREGMVHL
jgi:BON domain